MCFVFFALCFVLFCFFCFVSFWVLWFVCCMFVNLGDLWDLEIWQIWFWCLREPLTPSSSQAELQKRLILLLIVVLKILALFKKNAKFYSYFLKNLAYLQFFSLVIFIAIGTSPAWQARLTSLLSPGSGRRSPLFLSSAD